MRRAQDERARRLFQPAGTVQFKRPARIEPQSCAQRAPQDITGLTRWKVYGFDRPEMESVTAKPENQTQMLTLRQIET